MCHLGGMNMASVVYVSFCGYGLCVHSVCVRVCVISMFFVGDVYVLNNWTFLV